MRLYSGSSKQFIDDTVRNQIAQKLYIKILSRRKMVLKHIDCFVFEEELITNEGKKIQIFELKECTDEAVLAKWAEHFRHHYCSDGDLDKNREGFGYSRAEYLEKIKFPNISDRLGASMRSGDFCEILVADYAEYVLNYCVPRTRYDRKINPNTSSQGSDMLGFKVGENISKKDELLIFEVKGQASETNPKNKLQDAVTDSKKDVKRLGFSLNAIFQRLIEKGELEEAKIVARFQNSTDKPYTEKYAAAAIHSDRSFSKKILKDTSTSSHIDPDLFLLVIHQKKLMNFIHGLYRRASIC